MVLVIGLGGGVPEELLEVVTLADEHAAVGRGSGTEDQALGVGVDELQVTQRGRNLDRHDDPSSPRGHGDRAPASKVMGALFPSR